MTRVDDNCIGTALAPVKDLHSYSEPEKFVVTHIDLELRPVFKRRVLEAVAVLTIDRKTGDPTVPLVLDSRGLEITKVEVRSASWEYQETAFECGAPDPILGSRLDIQFPMGASHARITYRTSRDATALQWLDPAQTAGKERPFLYTQSQEIHARSWIPLQDSPSVRVTYAARVETEDGLIAVMSAENNPEVSGQGAHIFRMNCPIPPYLIALAVGDLEFAPTGKRTGVYAERPVIKRAAHEFAEAEKMILATEQLYGPYLWGRFDILVLPPSFPFGGMENPGLIFVTPTLIAGDRSAISVIAHELAHAWSGNLVTNATWRDFWLNEGFTTYIEYRIQEKLYGRTRSEMEQVLAAHRLHKEMQDLEPRDQVLHIDLAHRDPDRGATLVPYVKGALFLKYLEQAFGRPRFDAFLKKYFADFKFQSVTTERVIEYIRENLINKYPDQGSKISLGEWICDPGLPSSAPLSSSETLSRIEKQAHEWQNWRLSPSHVRTRNWTTHEWVHFLSSLPKELTYETVKSLDDAFHLTQSTNAEILFHWLLIAIRVQYRDAYPKLEEFLASVGRRLYIKPLFEELSKTDAGKQLACEIYSKVRSTYHPISQAAIDSIVGKFS